MSPAFTRLQRLLSAVEASSVAALERLVAGGGWFWKSFAAVLAISFVVTAPQTFTAHRSLDPEITAGFQYVIDHPFADVTQRFDPGTHLGKFNFRLTFRLLAHGLHFDARQFPLIAAGLGLCMLLLFQLAAWRLTHDRWLTAASTLAFGLTGPGMMPFTWTYPPDVLAFICLLLPYCWRSGPVVFLSVLAASFADERALIATLFLPLFLCSRAYWRDLAAAGSEAAASSRQDRRLALVALAALAAHAVLRVVLMRSLGLTTPTDPFLMPLLQQLRLFPITAYAPLEGFWILGAALLATLATAHAWGAATGIAAVTLTLLVAAHAVGDIGRSSYFIFPLTLAGVSMLAHWPRAAAQRLMVVIIAVNLLSLNYFIGYNKIAWKLPLPGYLLKGVTVGFGDF